MAETYQIRVIGILDEHWSYWFDRASIATEADSISVLTCEVVDQAALFSLLRKIRDAGLELQSVARIDVDNNTTSPTDND